MPKLAEIIGKNIKIRRRMVDQGISQSELSELAGVHRAQISKYEAGLQVPTDEVLDKLAKALKCEVEELIIGEPNQPSTGITEIINDSSRGLSPIDIFRSIMLILNQATELTEDLKDKGKNSALPALARIASATAEVSYNLILENICYEKQIKALSFAKAAFEARQEDWEIKEANLMRIFEELISKHPQIEKDVETLLGTLIDNKHRSTGSNIE